MQRLVMWLALACLLLTAGVLAWHSRSSDDSIPLIPLTPALPISSATPAAEPVHASIGDRTDSGPVAAATDTRIAVLEVELRCTLGAASPIVVPYRDVDVSVETPGSPTLLRVRTDERGIARFEVPGGHQCIANANSGPSAALSVELRGGEVVRASLLITARLVVQGRVVDEAGGIVAGADLLLLPWTEPDGQSPRTRQVGRTRADGSFSIGLGLGGRIGAEHDGFAPSPMFAIPPAADPTEPPVVHTLEIVLPMHFATIAVRVVDMRGNPVSHAEVELRSGIDPPPGASLASAPRRHRCGDDGRATFVVRPGRVDWVARKKGQATTRGKCDAVAAQTTTLSIRMLASCHVHGFVENQIGVRIADARVWSGAGETTEDFVVTDAYGAFRLDDLPPGTHELRAREGSSFAMRADALRARTRMDLAPGQVANWVAVLEPPALGTTVQGDVVDNEGRPVAGWRIAIRGGGKVGSTVTDDHGGFHCARPSPGFVDVLVHAPDNPIGAFATAVRLGLDPDAGPLHIVVEREPRTATMVGRVTSIDQAPLAATIVCYHYERRETARFHAHEDGVIHVPRIPPGVLDVYIEHPGKAPITRKRLRAEADVPFDLGLIVVGNAAALHGTLTGPGGTVPDEAIVALLTKERRIVGEYTAGTYRFASAPPGQHVLQVQGNGVAAANFVVQLTAGVDLEQKIELRAGVPRRFVARLPGQAEGVVSLAIRAADQAHTWTGSAQLRIDEPSARQGIAEFVAFMAPGYYEVIAWCGEAREARTTAQFTDGDDSPITLVLQPR